MIDTKSFGDWCRRSARVWYGTSRDDDVCPFVTRGLGLDLSVRCTAAETSLAGTLMIRAANCEMMGRGGQRAWRVSQSLLAERSPRSQPEGGQTRTEPLLAPLPPRLAGVQLTRSDHCTRPLFDPTPVKTVERPGRVGKGRPPRVARFGGAPRALALTGMLGAGAGEGSFLACDVGDTRWRTRVE